METDLEVAFARGIFWAQVGDPEVILKCLQGG
jgi:hypothetical protein